MVTIHTCRVNGRREKAEDYTSSQVPLGPALSGKQVLLPWFHALYLVLCAVQISLSHGNVHPLSFCKWCPWTQRESFISCPMGTQLWSASLQVLSYSQSQSLLMSVILKGRTQASALQGREKRGYLCSLWVWLKSPLMPCYAQCHPLPTFAVILSKAMLVNVHSNKLDACKF